MQLNLTSESFSQHSFSPSSSRVRECIGPLQGSTRTIASQFHLQSIRERRNRSQRNRRWKWVNVLPKILILTSRWSWHFVRGADYINVSICTLSRTRFCSTLRVWGMRRAVLLKIERIRGFKEPWHVPEHIAIGNRRFNQVQVLEVRLASLWKGFKYNVLLIKSLPTLGGLR